MGGMLKALIIPYSIQLPRKRQCVTPSLNDGADKDELTYSTVYLPFYQPTALTCQIKTEAKIFDTLTDLWFDVAVSGWMPFRGKLAIGALIFCYMASFRNIFSVIIWKKK